MDVKSNIRKQKNVVFLFFSFKTDAMKGNENKGRWGGLKSEREGRDAMNSRCFAMNSKENSEKENRAP